MEEMAHPDSANRRLTYLESVLDCTGDALFVTEYDPNGEAGHRICFVNDAFTRLTGYSFGDVAGMPPAFLCSSCNNPQVVDEMAAAFERGEKASFVLLNSRKDGSRFRAELFITPIAGNGGCDHVVAIQRSRPDTAAVNQDLGAVEEQFQSLADNLSEAVLIYRDKQPLFANDPYVALFGYSSRAEALCEISPLMNLPLEEPATAGNSAEGKQPAHPHPVYCEALRTDGSPLYLTMRRHTIAWRGCPATMLTIDRDARRRIQPGIAARPAPARFGILPHKASPAAASAKESPPDDATLLRELMDSVPVILAHKSRDLRYTYVNQTYAAWVGLPREQIIGHHVCDVRNEAHYQLMKERRAKVLSGDTVQYHTKCEFPGRGMCDLLTTLIPQRNESGEVEGYYSLVQDITDLKDVERALLQREQQLRLVMDSVPALISYRDRNLRFQYVNRPYYEWYGVKREDMIGRHMTDFMDLELFRRLKPYLDRVLAGEHVRLDQVINFPGVGKRNVHINFVPHKDENGHVVGFFALSQEMTASDGKLPADEDRNSRLLSDLSVDLLSNIR
jgi:PAS domain S-box-containing protein